MAAPGFHRLDPGHHDLVLAVGNNIEGTRMATASSDHRLRVWELNETSDIWEPVDSWIAHDAEVTNVKWNGPFVGEHLASIGEDGFVRVWHEDVNAAMNSGRRFKKIFERPSDTGVPFMALDFKNISNETYLAVITRDGFLSVFEPEDHDDLSAWRILWSEQICRPPPPRTEESGFRLSWHKEPVPPWPAVVSGLDRRSLSLAVAVGDTVKILRTDKERAFFLAATLEGARGLVRDVAWANGSTRGFDIIATASKDGFIRIHELHTPGTASLSTSANAQTNHENHGLTNGYSNRPIRSGIGAGIANGARGRRDEDSAGSGTVKQDSKLVAEFEAHDGAPWRVNWSELGDILVSSGDDGSIKLWKKAVDGKWLEAVEVDATKDA